MGRASGAGGPNRKPRLKTAMEQKRHRRVTPILIWMAAALLVTSCGAETERVSPAGGVPQFEVDASWPLPLPENWMLGQVAGIDVDGEDRIWIAQRPSSLTAHEAAAAADPPISICCVPAPSVMQFDRRGNLLRAWNSADGFEWADTRIGFRGGSFPHGIHVDHNGYVWVGGGIHQHHVLKFTPDGELLLSIGEPGRTGGSNDTALLGGPADMVVDPETNEIFIADGYINRRVIVFDAETGEYRRHWGAYGERPHDEPLGFDHIGTSEEDPARQFRGAVHGIVISVEGLVYVTDRENSRIQIFERDGSFVEEVFVRPETRSSGSTWDMSPEEEGYEEALAALIPGSTWDIALSEDPAQRWLYVADGTNNVVWIMERETLEIRGRFGRGGKQAGQFGWLHNIAVDSRGTIYTSEVAQDKRAQKFRRIR